MNIIDFFQAKTLVFNSENKCGFCWSFGAPLSESGMNSSKPANNAECCLHLFVTYYKTSSSFTRNSMTSLKNREWTDHIFTLFAVQNANLGTNTYNEQPLHPISESMWSTHLKPIQECLGNGNELVICEPFELIRWDMEVVQRFEDQNYTGWKINGTFRENL